MKKIKLKSTIGLATLFFSLGSLVGCNGANLNYWTHYSANDPTETSRGNIEFWADAHNEISLKAPTDSTVFEGSTPDYEKFSSHKELWIENEVKVTNSGNSFVVPLKQLPSVFYNESVDYSNADLKIIKDVTLESSWTALGTLDKPFTGTLDGNNKTISNLTIDSKDYYQGLFGVVSSITIKDLKLDNVNIQSAGFSGAIAAFVRGGESNLIENCHVLSGNIKSEGFDDLGGIVGGIYEQTQNITIKNCSNSAKVESSAEPGRVGGIVGIAGPSVSMLLENCVNKGQIVGTNASALVGGTRGLAQGATFTYKNCSNEGTAVVPYIGFVNSSANSEQYIRVVIDNTSVTESMLPTLFAKWRSGGTEGGILSVSLNNVEYKYFLIPTYTYSVTQEKIVSLQKVNSVDHSLNTTPINEVSLEDWNQFIGYKPKAAIYNEDGTYKGISPTTNCYAPNDYYIKAKDSRFSGFVNSWVKVVA